MNFLVSFSIFFFPTKTNSIKDEAGTLPSLPLCLVFLPGARARRWFIYSDNGAN